VLVDCPHELKNISEGAELEDESNIIGCLNGLEQSDDTRMPQFGQDELLYC